MTAAILLGGLEQDGDEGGGVGEVILFALLVLAVIAVIGCMLMLLPILIAIRHGWRWMLATIAVSWVAGLPLRLAYDADELTESPWGFLSFPFWIAVAVIAWRGPPSWFPTGRRRNDSVTR